MPQTPLSPQDIPPLYARVDELDQASAKRSKAGCDPKLGHFRILISLASHLDEESEESSAMIPAANIAGHNLVALKSDLAVACVQALQKRVMEAGIEQHRADGPEAQRAAAVAQLRAIAESGDREAFMALFSSFAPRIKNYVLRLGAPPAQADDLVQDVMLTVWRRAALFDPKKASPSTWIFTIARNRRIDVLRRENRPELDPEDPALTPEQTVSADRKVEVDQRQQILQDAVKKLPADQAKLLKLAYFEDLSHSKIAETLDLPLGTVKSRIRLAIGKLKALVEEDL